MIIESRRLLWQSPLTILACIAGSLVAVWAASLAIGFTTDPSIVAALSAVLSGAVIVVELQARRKHTRNSAT